jgi:hypothetical protein
MEGTVKVIQDLQTFPSGFSKREFVVEVEDGKYPQLVNFECLKEKAELIDALSIGDQVKVRFDIRGREYNGRYFVNLAAWKIEKAGEGGGGAPTSTSAPAPQDAPPADATDRIFDDEADSSDITDEPPF